MKYIVDNKRKSQMIKDIRKKLGAKVIIPTIIWRALFAVIICLVVIGACGTIYLGSLESEDAWFIYLVGVVVVICGALLLSIIPLCLRSYVLRKYMMPWVGLKDEEIVFADKMITYRFENIFWQGYMEKYWWSLYIRYRQVIRIEYDEVQRMLRVYGPRGSRKWHDPYYEQCIGKVGANPEWKDETWLEIPEYFEHFDEIVAQIEERTGLKTVNKVRPFETYK